MVLESVRDANGSCQHLDFLDENEKAVFRTAYEIDQMVILRMADARQRYICQGQSLNLFFPKIGDEWTQEQIQQLYQYMDDCHSYAEQSKYIKALYYVRSQAGIAADTGKSCLACEG
jgi:ribonucleoside-diphosphate reductase alpha chain